MLNYRHTETQLMSSMNNFAPMSLIYHSSKLTHHSSTLLAACSKNPVTCSPVHWRSVKMYGADNWCWSIIGNLCCLVHLHFTISIIVLLSLPFHYFSSTSFLPSPQHTQTTLVCNSQQKCKIVLVAQGSTQTGNLWERQSIITTLWWCKLCAIN